VAVILMSLTWARGSGTSPSAASPQEQSGSAPVFRAASRLVLVDVLAPDPTTGLPLSTLKLEDFRVLDNGHQVPITTFDSGAKFNTRPLGLWLVVICNEQNKGPSGEFASGWFSGKEAAFRPALNDLAKDDRVGVAHWCDEGTAELDLRPTQDRNAAIDKLQEVLRPISYAAPPEAKMRVGELTLQRLIRLIIDDAHQSNPQPLPVLLFLHSDHTGMPVDEVNLLVDELLETSGIAFGIKNADVKEYPRGHFFGERGAVLHYLAAETGGQYFSVQAESYASTLQTILQQLHFRYELGFKPPVVDGKRHRLKVEFIGEAKKRYKAVRLRYRPEYIPNTK
jgi:hypothetical protein